MNIMQMIKEAKMERVTSRKPCRECEKGRSQTSPGPGSVTLPCHLLTLADSPWSGRELRFCGGWATDPFLVAAAGRVFLLVTWKDRAWLPLGSGSADSVCWW